MPGSDEVGVQSGGFRIIATPSEYRVVAWGYWAADVIDGFARRVSTAGHLIGPLTNFVLDASELKPQSAEAQEALRRVFRVLAASSFFGAKVTSSNALTRMQLARLVRECGLYGRVVFEDSE